MKARAGISKAMRGVGAPLREDREPAVGLASPGAATMRSATSFWNISVRLDQNGGQAAGVSQRTRSSVPTL